GCRCSRLNFHGSKQLVSVVQASAETPFWRYCAWHWIADLWPVLRRPPLAFLKRLNPDDSRPIRKARAAIKWARERAWNCERAYTALRRLSRQSGTEPLPLWLILCKEKLASRRNQF